MPWWIILIVVIVLLVLYVIKIQNQLVMAEETVNNSFSQIGVNQQSRFDALTQLAKATGSYSEHERQTLLDVIGKRQPANSTDAVEKNEELIKEVISKINVVVERYPELKASELYSNTMNSINDYENKVRVSRMLYNDTITKLNRIIKQFPSSVVASMLGFTQKEYLKVDEKKTDMPDLDFKA